jgi:predicted aspartyl protease
MKKRMGIFYTQCSVSGHLDRETRAEIPRMLVDTGSELTWIAESSLRMIGVRPEKREMPFSLADGRTVSREVGFALVYVAGRFTTDEVVFAQKGDLELLGARTLEGLNLVVDPARKRLVAAGPYLAASAAERSSPAPNRADEARRRPSPRETTGRQAA